MAYTKNAVVYATLDCTYIHQTDLAWLVSLEDSETWIPKSVSNYKQGDDEIEVEEWWLKANDIDY